MSPKSFPDDTGAQLRALYQPEGGVGAIFSPKVADYVASRPDYPAALFDALREACSLHPGAVVADIGAGTGLLTQGLRLGVVRLRVQELDYMNDMSG